MTQTQRLDVRELINRNPLSRFQKQIIFLGFCVIALDGFDIAIMGFIAPTLKLEWGVSNHQLGLVISAALIGLALGAIFSGPLADWLGRKKIIINSVFFFGFWTIATAFSHNIEQMMFFRFMTGLGLGAAMPNIGTLVSEYAPERQRSFIITVIFCGFTFGAAAGGFTASWLIPQFGWHSLMLWLVYFMGLFLVYILGSWLPTLVKEVGLTVSQAAVMTAIYQAGGTLGSLFAGWLMDRINPHRALGMIYAVGGLFTMAMGYAAGSFALLCMLAFISGACLNGANTGMNALSARYYPTQARATGSSWMHGVGRIGAILSAFAGAEMMALNLPFESVFLILGIPAALTVAGLAAKGIFAAGNPPAASPAPASVRGA